MSFRIRPLALNESLLAVLKSELQKARKDRKMQEELSVITTISSRLRAGEIILLDDMYTCEIVDELKEAQKHEKKCYRAYRKAKTFVRDCLRKYWTERIRFASRAIGNMWDYSLEMIATPPTADEYAGICWRGGAGFVRLH